MAELLIGAGNDRRKKVKFTQSPGDWKKLTTLDIDPGTKPDVVHDLNICPYPFADNSFDEIHAYEVLEHCGRQGDWLFFFRQFEEFWRILKPEGFFIASVPMWDSQWAWGDPGHTRVICKHSLMFLSQSEYSQVGTTAMTDYRPFYKGDFKTMGTTDDDDQSSIGDSFGFVLRAVK